MSRDLETPPSSDARLDDGPAKGIVRRRVLPPMVRLMRPHQWVKNLLVVLPILLAHQVENRSKLASAGLAFAAFCLCASAVYLLNDLVDLEADRRHPSKCNRPLAAGEVSIRGGTILLTLLLCAAFGLAAMLPAKFAAALAIYLVANLTYSLWLKRKMLVDVILLSCLYTLRIVAGAVAVQVPMTMWLLAFSTFFFLSLAFIKRYSELVEVEEAGGGKIVGRGYAVSDLRIIESVGPASGYLSVMVFCNYLDSATVRRLYLRPEILWLVVPILLYWVTRVWFVARRRGMHEDPVVFAMRDRVSWIAGVLIVLIVLAAWVPRPSWWPF